jgi:hypothetical protein
VCANVRRDKYGNIRKERNKKPPSLESIINLLIHKHERNKKTATRRESEEQEKEVCCVRAVWFTSPPLTATKATIQPTEWRFYGRICNKFDFDLFHVSLSYYLRM